MGRSFFLKSNQRFTAHSGLLPCGPAPAAKVFPPHDWTPGLTVKHVGILLHIDLHDWTALLQQDVPPELVIHLTSRCSYFTLTRYLVMSKVKRAHMQEATSSILSPSREYLQISFHSPQHEARVYWHPHNRASPLPVCLPVTSSPTYLSKALTLRFLPPVAQSCMTLARYTPGCPHICAR